MLRPIALAFLLLPAVAWTADAEQQLVIRDHRFTPAEIHVPAGKKVRVLIDNQDPTPEEFDSKDLKREKVVLGKTKGVVIIGPLSPGRYSFMGEFFSATAQGVVIAE